MKIEPRDHAPKPLTKRFVHVGMGTFFRCEGRTYRYEGCGKVLCLDTSSREDWGGLDREITIVSAPESFRWTEIILQYFPTKFVEPETVPVHEMDPGQPFVLPILLDGVVNGRYIRGDHGAMTRLSDGKVFSSNGSVEGIPINGKFVEEDQPQ